NAIYAGRTFMPAGTRLTNSSETIRLVEGLISIRLDSGARVVVESPAEFSLNSSNSMYLYSGDVYAVVASPQAEGFTLKTPGCDIVDLGTEFGVRVIGGSSDIHMTRGRAQITASGAVSSGSDYLLEAGNARRVDLSGQIKNIKLETDTFARSFSSDSGFVWRGHSVDLADIVGGGNGISGVYYRGMSVDPSNGKIVPWAVMSDSYSHNTFLPVNDSAFIDGVFVPDGGEGPIPVSTTGLTWTGPDTSGFYKYNIGAMVEVLDQRDIVTDILSHLPASDRMLEKAIKGGVPKHLMRIHAGNVPASDSDTNLVMHANIGITFDLTKIRPLLADNRIAGFNCLFGVSEEIVALEKISDTEMNIDVWVLIDGQERFSRQDIDATMLTEIDLQIDDQDRFLSLVVTDSGDRRAASFDWGLFLNPRLIIE
ncbi:MAG: FecR domain-containing protein, partial [Sedimentisphaerales bacterium]|nr:FecR domain-containing protein [Sedimentisphaerales bacterium]